MPTKSKTKPQVEKPTENKPEEQKSTNTKVVY